MRTCPICGAGRTSEDFEDFACGAKHRYWTGDEYEYRGDLVWDRDTRTWRPASEHREEA
jgi:hypothetical protein